MLTPNSRINQLAIIVMMLIVQGPNVALSDGDSTLTFAELFLREGLYYKPFSNVPFSGELGGQVTGRLSDGMMEGEWLFYFDNGQLHKKGHFLNSKKHGFWVEYEMNGAQQYVLEFEYGVPTIADFDWACGDRKKGPIETKGECVNGKKEGKWTLTDNENGLLHIGEFKSDKQHGLWEAIDTQCLNIVYEGKYVEGLREGVWIFTHAECSPAKVIEKISGTYRAGKKVADHVPPK